MDSYDKFIPHFNKIFQNLNPCMIYSTDKKGKKRPYSGMRNYFIKRISITKIPTISRAKKHGETLRLNGISNDFILLHFSHPIHHFWKMAKSSKREPSVGECQELPNTSLNFNVFVTMWSHFLSILPGCIMYLMDYFSNSHHIFSFLFFSWK